MVVILNTKSSKSCIGGCAAIRSIVKCGRSEVTGIFAKEADYVMTFIRLGICQAIAKIMQTHQSISSVILEATKLVVVLSSHSQNLVIFGEGGIIPELVVALKYHVNNVELAECLCTAISNTIEHKENRKLFDQAELNGVFDLVMAKYNSHNNVNYTIVSLIYESTGNLG
jgi:hypothetical protein